MFLLSKASAQQSFVLSWKLEANLPSEDQRYLGLGVAGPVTGYLEDMLVVAGGANFPGPLPWKGGKKKYYDVIYLYRKDKAGLRRLGCSVKLPFSIAYAANCSTSKGIVYAGGENESGVSSKVFLMKWDYSTKQTAIEPMADLPEALTNASATCIGNRVYIAGGERQRGVSDKLYALDLNDPAKGWKFVSSLPAPVSHTVFDGFAWGDSVFLYVAGGRCKQANGISDIYDQLWKYDVTTDKWSKGKSLPYPVCAGTGIAVTGKGLLIFGGDRGEVFHKVEMINASLDKQISEEDRRKLTAEKNNLLSTHPGFSKDILLYDFSKDIWKRVGQIPFRTPVTTTAVKHDEYVYIPSGEIRAGVRTPAILSVKLSPLRK